MKLETQIAPRKDGTVRVHTPSGNTYEFSGEPLTCDVEDDKDVGFLLDTGNFYPSDEADIPAALGQASPPVVVAAKKPAAPKKPATKANKKGA